MKILLMILILLIAMALCSCEKPAEKRCWKCETMYSRYGDFINFEICDKTESEIRAFEKDRTRIGEYTDCK